MELLNQQTISGEIGGRSMILGCIAIFVAALGLLATVVTWSLLGGPATDANAGAGVAAGSVSDPAHVQFRRSEREDLHANTLNSVSNPVNVELRRSERAAD
jgi:hypothetical protein